MLAYGNARLLAITEVGVRSLSDANASPLYRSIRCACPLSGIQRLSAIREQKMYCVYGIAVGTSTEIRYTKEFRYWEGPLSEVPL